ncbi:OsmC family protein [Paucilactobacillus nenjiangensis]|jgi:organic hydroperoxide reductase OsmC/OhrA|uniref:OsmC family peroxiredoxin n=2 Tax=Paucilactobacillus nenjiangensis TaxID=1296540 RepID=A0A5P1X325_9LACO|nr:OsmC family protein [Paucilactobacillus nenjiangensis]QER68186.1 hypothetical protein F0161_10265 [Paucilactobacillus nenjiangensis]
MKSDESLYHTTTINPHGMPGRAYVLGNGELNVQVSSPRKPEEPGTNPEQLLGLAQATCLASTLQTIQEGRGIEYQSEVRVGVDLKYDTHGLRFVIEVQARIPNVEPEEAQKQLDFAESRCPVSKLLSGNEDVSVKLVDKFTV